MQLHDHSSVMRFSLAAALLAATATVALAQQGAPKTPPYSTQSGSAADPVAPMVYDPTSNAFVPQGSGFAAQSFVGTGALQIATAGIGTVTVQAAGSGSGLAFVFQGSNDAGTTWQTLAGFVPSSGAAATSFSGNGVWQVNPAGFTLFRINLTALAAGTEIFTVTTSTAPAVFNGANIAVSATTTVDYSAATGAGVPAKAAYVGANKSGSITGLTLDGANNLNVNCQANCNGSNASVGSTGSAVPASGTYVAGTNGGSLQGVAVNGSGQVAIQAPPSLPALPSNQSVRVDQLAGTAIDTNSGNRSAGTQRVVIATDQPSLANPLIVTANPGVGLAAANALGCAGASLANTVFTPISQTGNTKLVTKATSKTVYLCGLFVVGADAEDLSLVSGTQTTTPCDTGTAAMIGGTSAANGANLAANGGFNVGNGQSAIAASGSGADVCLFENGSGRVAGYLVTAQF